MKWNPFNLVESSIENTKNLLFPIEKKYWIKLAFVSMFSQFGTRSGSGGSGNVQLPGDVFSGGIDKTFSFLNIGILGFIGSIILGLYLMFNYITSKFSFIFIDALVNKKYSIKKSWRDNTANGVSFFWFRIIIGLLVLVIVAIIGAPYVLNVLANGGFGSYYFGMSVWQIISGVFPYILLLVLWFVIIGTFMTFVYDISLPALFQRKKGMKEAVSSTFKIVKKQKLEAFVYVLAKILLGIAVAMIGAIAGILLIIVALLIGLLIGVLIFLLLMIISKVLATVVVVILGIAYLLLSIFALAVVLLPLTTFIGYFNLLCYEKFFNVKLLKK